MPLPEPLLDLELFDFSVDKLVSELSFLSDEYVVPVSALELGVNPGKLKLGKPNKGLLKPIPARPPNGKNNGGAFDDEVVEVVVDVVDDVELDAFEELVVVIEEAVVDPEVGSMNIFIEAGKPAAKRLALNELRAAEDG